MQLRIKELEENIAEERQTKEKVAVELESVRREISELKKKAEKEADACKALSVVSIR